MKKALQLALGILTAIGGFFDIGNLVTAAQAGASYRFQLLWALAFGTIIVIFLVEMSGRYAAVTGKAIPEAMREHFGVRVSIPPILSSSLLALLTLAAEIGGVALALQLIPGISFRVWAMPVGILIWLFLWRSTLRRHRVQHRDRSGCSRCVSSLRPLGSIRRTPRSCAASCRRCRRTSRRNTGCTPSASSGALIAPYLFYFYSSGAVEDKWDNIYIWVNRVVSVHRHGVRRRHHRRIAHRRRHGAPSKGHRRRQHQSRWRSSSPSVFPFWGFASFAVIDGHRLPRRGARGRALARLHDGADLRLGLGRGPGPGKHARFSLTYTGAILVCVAGDGIRRRSGEADDLPMALNAMRCPWSPCRSCC